MSRQQDHHELRLALRHVACSVATREKFALWFAPQLVELEARFAGPANLSSGRVNAPAPHPKSPAEKIP